MCNSDPTWLDGVTISAARVRRWVHSPERQFVVLPFYENNERVPGAERFMLWGRTLSDGRFYPIPHDWYSLCLRPQIRGLNTHYYEWFCHMAEDGATMQLETVALRFAVEDGVAVYKGLAHSVGPVTPEPVQLSSVTEHWPATEFYPDAGLWNEHRSQRGLRSRQPVGLEATPSEGGVYAPVEIFLQSHGCVQEFRIRGASTRSWNRVETDYDPQFDPETWHA